MKPVLTKRDFVRRFQRGEFGNRNLVWNSLKEWKKSGYRGLIHFRNRVAGGETIYNVPANRVPGLWKERGCTKEDWYLAAMAPHHKNLIQGEVRRSERGLELFYSTELGLPMRNALATNSRTVYGIIAVLTLRCYLCPNSYDWLMELLDIYGGHIVEFSCFDCEWGTVPFHNTVVWEVRRY